MTDTTLAPGRIDVRETDLLEAGIVALESGQYFQCQRDMRRTAGLLPSGELGPMHCAEGVFAELLIKAYPERFGWTSTGLFHEAAPACYCGGGHAGSTLTVAQWNTLHPEGSSIADYAAASLGHETIAAANDNGKTFVEIAEALRRARASHEATR